MGLSGPLRDCWVALLPTARITALIRLTIGLGGYKSGVQSQSATRLQVSDFRGFLDYRAASSKRHHPFE